VIVTFSKAIADYWKDSENIEPSEVLNIDNIKYYRIDIDEGDERLRRPDYVSLALQAQASYTDVLARRLKPPMYVPEMGGFWAMTIVNGNKTIVFGRNPSLLFPMFCGPGANEGLRYRQLKTQKEMLELLQKAYEEGIRQFAIVSIPEYIEPVPITMALVALGVEL
jgi:hypothetical protein